MSFDALGVFAIFCFIVGIAIGAFVDKYGDNDK